MIELVLARNSIGTAPYRARRERSVAGRKLPVRKLVSVTTRSNKWHLRTLLVEHRTHLALQVRQLPTARHVMHQPKGSRAIPSSRGYHCLSSSNRNSSSNQGSRIPGSQTTPVIPAFRPASQGKAAHATPDKEGFTLASDKHAFHPRVLTHEQYPQPKTAAVNMMIRCRRESC